MVHQHNLLGIEQLLCDEQRPAHHEQVSHRAENEKVNRQSMSTRELSVCKEHHLRTPDDVIRHAASGIPDILGIAQVQAKDLIRQHAAILHPLMF